MGRGRRVGGAQLVLALGIVGLASSGCALEPEPAWEVGERSGALVEPDALVGGEAALTLGELPDVEVVVEALEWSEDGNAGPAGLRIDHIRLTISMADYEPWAQWHESFVIDGKCSDGDELSGELNMLGPEPEAPTTLELGHVGITSLEQQAVEANKEEVASFSVDLYAERMVFAGAY